MEQAATIGLDIAKYVFQVHGADAAGHVLFRKRIARVKAWLGLTPLQKTCSNPDPLMGFQPTTPVGEEPLGRLDLVIERCRVVAFELSDRLPIKSVYHFDHCWPPLFDAWARSSSIRTRMFSE
jgi:hypothetical protein